MNQNISETRQISGYREHVPHQRAARVRPSIELGCGIDPERFAEQVGRIPHRLSTHSPDRGLDRVLRLFPRVREVYPDAALEVFYGFEMARQRNPAFIAAIEQAAKQEGVTLHGRVGQDRLAQEYLKADALLYPAVMPNGQPFDETYCVSVVEARAAGCFPVQQTTVP